MTTTRSVSQDNVAADSEDRWSRMVRERDEAQAALATLQAEVCQILRISKGRGRLTGQEFIVPLGQGIRPSEAPTIGQLLRESRR